jgi:uncharacterized protein (TIGR02646 family)
VLLLLRRIEAKAGKMKVEHWKCQDDHPEHQLDYWNLLGACMGNEGEPGSEQHCDTKKGNQSLSRNPSNPLHRIAEVIHYLTDGSIRSTDNQLDAELGEDPRKCRPNSGRVLNLNLAFLMNNRRAALDAFKTGLQKRGTLNRPILERLYAKWRGDAPGNLDAFSPVIAFWLHKRLQKA